MKNSRSLQDRVQEYIKDGWAICTENSAVVIMEKDVGCGIIRRAMAPDGQYDTSIPLPPDAGDKTDHDIVVEKCMEFNKQVASGEIPVCTRLLGCPAAWLDYQGLERNEKLKATAWKDAMAVLRKDYEGKLYVRQGSRFVKV